MSLESAFRVYETLLGKAYAMIRLIDGTTGAPLAVPLEVRDLVARTPDSNHDPLPLPNVIVKVGLLGFLYPDDVAILPKVPTTDVLDAPSTHAAAEISGTLLDPSRRYNPTAFSVALSAVSAGSSPAEVRVFRTPLGMPVTRAGVVHGTLRYEQTPSAPVPFARITLAFSVTRRLSDPPRTILVEAETDPAGDFVLPLDRLPALTGSETSRQGTLTVRVPSSGAAPAASGLATMHAATIGPAGGATAAQILLDVKPGAVLRVPELPAKNLVAHPT